MTAAVVDRYAGQESFSLWNKRCGKRVGGFLLTVMNCFQITVTAESYEKFCGAYPEKEKWRFTFPPFLFLTCRSSGDASVNHQA
jgi:hypothetical protein